MNRKPETGPKRPGKAAPPGGGGEGAAKRKAAPLGGGDEGAAKSGPGDPLERYRAKRSAGRTPEPFGATGDADASRQRLFVVQKHAARRTHHDLRLEWGGTLWSWAVPNGPSADPSERRLAVQVEDHPVEYADFEGIIPAGNYGAGAVIVWDRGVWIPHDDPEEGMREGKLHFDLHGHKMRGEWILVRTKAGPDQWLLFKKADAWARKGAPPFPDESVLSGLTVEELRDGVTRAEEIRAVLEKQGAPRRRVDASTLKPMLAETAEAPFTRSGWLFELKYDGYRLVVAREPDGSAQLVSRNGNDLTPTFPEIARAMRALPYEGIVMDGEVVVLDEQGRPDFNRLQHRGRLQRRTDIDRATVEHPATLLLFDLLGFEDFDVRPLPLLERKELLRRLLPPAGALRYSDHVEERGEELFEQVQKLGLEGIMAKKADAPYRSGRFSQWLKIKADRSGDFVVCGYTEPQGSRAGFGALHLGAFQDGALVYVGRVGTGFDNQKLEDLPDLFRSARRSDPPCTGAVPKGKEHVWVEPRWVAQVRFKTWTGDGMLRHAVFERLREDKRIEECLLPAAPEVPAEEPHPPAPAAATAAPERTLKFTNLDKVFWPEERYTKRDLIEYYRTISPWLLPYLRERPVVLTRYPDGIDGKSFYQKNAPAFLPDWIRRVRVWSAEGEKEIDYIVCDDEETLLFLANLGSIPLHIWSSRVSTLQQPDWCILDLDPKGAPFEHVVRLAIAIRKLCEEIGLEPFIKTSGSTGLHVLLPLGGLCTYEQSRMLGQLIARVILDEHREIATIARALSAREGKVYLDFLQNRHGQLLVVPFSVRPLPGAPVSTPLEWSEVSPRLDHRSFTIRTVPPRLKKLGRDPLSPVLSSKPELGKVLARLEEKLRET